MKNKKAIRLDNWERAPEKGMLPTLPDETLSSRWNRFHLEPVAYLEKQHFLEFLEPQAHWHAGCQLGNGDLGAMLYGPPEATMFAIGKTDLWDYSSFGKSNMAEGDFQLFRQAVQTRDDKLFQELKAKDAQQFRQAPTGKPGGRLCLELFAASKVMNFKQRLSFAHAEVVQSWQSVGYHRQWLSVTLTSFVHAARNVLVVHIKVTGTECGKFLKEPIGFSLRRDQDPEMAAATIHTAPEQGWIEQELSGGQRFVLMVGAGQGRVEFQPAWDTLLGRIYPESDEITLYLTGVTSRDAENPVARASENLADARQAGFETLRQTHRDWWHQFWHRGYVRTPWPKIEHKWYQSLYLQASTSRPGRMSPGLQGNWIKENYPAWNADFHANFNMQVITWNPYTANRLELAEPFYRLFAENLPRFTQDAKQFFGMRGACLPIACGPDGFSTTGFPLKYWIGGGGWIGEHFWWHYRYSGDLEFLRRTAYPFLRAAALFYEDFLQEDRDGTLFASPTIHMEVLCSYREGWGKNATWDLAVITRTFQMVCEAAKALHADEDDRKRWESILARLAPLPATADGVWMEYADKGGLWHMNEYGRFMPIFPMELVGADSGPESLRLQARQTIEEYYRFRGETAKEVENMIVGIMLATALARMGDGERVMAMSESLFRLSTPNALVASRESFYVQADAPLGMALLLNEMLLQSYDGIVRLFPAVPKATANVAFHSLRAQGGFLVTAERRTGLTMYAIIQSCQGNMLRLRNPFIGEHDLGIQVKIYRLQDDISLATVEEQMGLVALVDRVYLPGEIIELPTEKGAVYLISKEIPWFSNVPMVEE